MVSLQIWKEKLDDKGGVSLPTLSSNTFSMCKTNTRTMKWQLPSSKNSETNTKSKEESFFQPFIFSSPSLLLSSFSKNKQARSELQY